MTKSELRKAARLIRAQRESEIQTANVWVNMGKILNESSFVDGEGRHPFPGSLERFREHFSHDQDGVAVSDDDVALFCKQEADAWYEGFEDDSLSSRMNFTATLFNLLKEVRVTA